MFFVGENERGGSGRERERGAGRGDATPPETLVAGGEKEKKGNGRTDLIVARVFNSAGPVA